MTDLLCSEDDCRNPARSRGLCNACYLRHRRLGTLPTEWDRHGRLWSNVQSLPRSRCTGPACDRIADHPVSGLCRGHYSQRHKGKPLTPLRHHITLGDRLLRHGETDDTTGCWIWTGCLNSEGRGHMRWQGKMQQVHRLAYEFWVGPIGGASVHHKCAKKRCFNPAHLELGTHLDNVLEMHERRSLRAHIVFLERRIAELEGRTASP